LALLKADMSVPLCGPKCSICCAVFSAWAFIMLVRRAYKPVPGVSHNLQNALRDLARFRIRVVQNSTLHTAHL